MSHMITAAQPQLDKLDTWRMPKQHNLFIPLSFVDDYNSVSIGDKTSMDKCLGDAAEMWGMECDKDK